MKHIKTSQQFNESSDNKISKLIKRKLDGDILTKEEILLLHNWLANNDKDYSDRVDKQLRKDLKKYAPKGTEIK